MKYPENKNERFTVQYIITINDKRSIEEHASDITLEQTVEVPEDCIPDKHFEDGIIGIDVGDDNTLEFLNLDKVELH